MKKTGKGLAEYAKAQIGKPYWWGTFGQTATDALLSQKRRQYPDYYQASDFQSQIGQRVHDCVGLIKGYLWSETPESAPVYNGSQDVAVDGLYRSCEAGGSIDTIPEIPGVCVFMKNLGHVGVYIGDGIVVEAMGHAYGVVQTNLLSRGWAFWGMPSWIDYESDEPPEHLKEETAKSSAGPTAPEAEYHKHKYRVEINLLMYGNRGPQVLSLQQLLNAKGFGPLEEDSVFGVNTKKAVIKAQEAIGSRVDGEFGGETFAALWNWG